MIRKISANQNSFKAITFSKGLNIVLADRADDSTNRDSRNGLGKSTLIEIIQFCLGANINRNKGLMVSSLKGWEFSLEILIDNQYIIVTRGIDNSTIVSVEGETSSWPLSPKIKNGKQIYTVNEWNSLLANLCFGLPFVEKKDKYTPNFRSLISYFIRRNKDAFSTPFEYYRKQTDLQKQISNAFLLNLAWEDAADIQKLKDRKKVLNNLIKAVKAGVVQGLSGSLGDLEARKVRLKTQAELEAQNIDSFKVHPQYEQIQLEADRLTEEIHKEVDANTIDKRMLALYEKSLSEEQPPMSDNIERLYEEAGIALPGITLRRLEDVKSFHNTIITNRRAFLSTEVIRLKQQILYHVEFINNKINERSSKMAVLKAYGALKEYTLLQEQYMGTINDLNSLTTTIENIKSFNNGLSKLKIDQEILQQKARRDYDERLPILEQAISLFNSYSEYLYNAPGKLVIDIGPKGFEFKIDIDRSGSTGIGNMKVFCYDLMLARLWAEHSPSPKLLIHDSIIFDGVDERQRALALELAASEAEQQDYQYICTLNSDNIPWNEFSETFYLNQYIKLRLTDADINGCLLGIRF